MSRAASIIGLASLLLTACAQTPAPEGPTPRDAVRKVTFVCPGNAGFTATFQGNHATLDSGGQQTELTGQVVASGIHYAGGGHDLRGKGYDVTWTDPSGTVRQCQDQEWAMKQPQVQEPLAEIGGTSWQLVHFQSSDDSIGTIVPPNVERYNLTFGKDGMLAMKLDCNRATSKWTGTPTSARGGTISISPGAMTRAMCQPGAIDTKIAQDMTRARSYTLANGQLNIALEADSGIYVWEPLKEPAN